MSARMTEAGCPARAWRSVTTPVKMVVMLLTMGVMTAGVKSLGVRASATIACGSATHMMKSTVLRTKLLCERSHGRCGGGKDLGKTLGFSSLCESCSVSVDGWSSEDRDGAERERSEGSDRLEQHGFGVSFLAGARDVSATTAEVLREAKCDCVSGWGLIMWISTRLLYVGGGWLLKRKITICGSCHVAELAYAQVHRTI